MLRLIACITCSLSMFAYLLGHTTGTVPVSHYVIIVPALILVALAITWRPDPFYVVKYHAQGYGDRPYV